VSYKKVRNLFEWRAIIMLFVGIVTAALNATFGGFTPVMWFVIALAAILIIICTEVSQIREFLQSKK